MEENRIYLTEIAQEDAEFLYHLFQNPEYTSFYEEETTQLDWEKRIGTFKKSKTIHEIIRLTSTKQPIGWVAYYRDDFEKNTFCIQILIFEPQYSGMGYGTEVMIQLKTLIFNQGGHKIRLWTHEKNLKAQNFYRKHGFIITGHSLDEVDRGRKLEPFYCMEYKKT